MSRPHSRWASDALFRAGVDDNTRILLPDHIWRKGLSDIEDTSEVDAHHRVPLLLEVGQGEVEGERRGLASYTGIVLQDVDLPIWSVR